MFQGSIVALITPWENNTLDEEALVNLIKWHNQSGTSAIVVCGSTGEGALLTEKERENIISLALKHATVPIIVGCGSPSTTTVIEQVKQAQNLKAHAVLVVSPYYIKTTQEGIYQHFKTIHEASDIPIILYNNPGRAVIEIAVVTAMRLFELKRIIGIKDSTSDTGRAEELRTFTKKPIAVLSGDDPYIAEYLAHGGNGFISVTANIKPKEMSELWHAWHKGHKEDFTKLNSQLMPLHYAMMLEPNPIPVKAALKIMGKCSNEARLPLVKASPETIAELKDLL